MTEEFLGSLARLPRQASWETEAGVIDFWFESSICRISETDRVGASIVEDWRRLLIFGGMSVNKGGGAQPWFAIDPETNDVVGIDVEREDSSAVFFVSSSIRQFVRIFSSLDEFLGSGRQLPPDAVQTIRAIDDKASIDGEWIGLIEYITGGALVG